MSTEYSDYERAKERAKAGKILSRIAVHAAKIRAMKPVPETENEPVHLPTRTVPDSYVFERNWLGFWRKRPTNNTKVRNLPKAIGE